MAKAAGPPLEPSSTFTADFASADPAAGRKGRTTRWQKVPFTAAGTSEALSMRNNSPRSAADTPAIGDAASPEAAPASAEEGALNFLSSAFVLSSRKTSPFQCATAWPCTALLRCWLPDLQHNAQKISPDGVHSTKVEQPGIGALPPTPPPFAPVSGSGSSFRAATSKAPRAAASDCDEAASAISPGCRGHFHWICSALAEVSPARWK
mmetsp:Transcript_7746/g.21619  ORF Transcript_7746/g.21619 Transcript_7746/m.21619 type:complete len:208 (+) Transcript_7746:443-1066(+)